MQSWHHASRGNVLFLLLRLHCRHRADPDVYRDRVSQGRPEELCLQLCSHVDEARVPQQDRCQIQKEDRGNGQVGGCFYHLIACDKRIFQNAAAIMWAQQEHRLGVAIRIVLSYQHLETQRWLYLIYVTHAQGIVAQGWWCRVPMSPRTDPSAFWLYHPEHPGFLLMAAQWWLSWWGDIMYPIQRRKKEGN